MNQSKGILKKDVEDTLRFYTKMCSMSATADSLSNLGVILANDGVCEETGKRFMSSRTARIAKTLMLTCGMYDGSGTFAIKVGIPTKSGVGGGLLSVSDKRAGIGVFGPALDTQGNSIAGCKLLREASRDASSSGRSQTISGSTCSMILNGTGKQKKRMK